MKTTDDVTISLKRSELYFLYIGFLVGNRMNKERHYMAEQISGKRPSMEELKERAEFDDTGLRIIDKFEAELPSDAIQVANDTCNSFFIDEEHLKCITEEVKNHIKECEDDGE